MEKFQQNAKVETFSSGYYSTTTGTVLVLAFRIPPAQIKLMQNVLQRMRPSVNVDKIRLPGKSCASCMMHKSAELSKQQQWHLNSYGTTLDQTKKAVFLINGLVLGVCDVSDGSA